MVLSLRRGRIEQDFPPDGVLMTLTTHPRRRQRVPPRTSGRCSGALPTRSACAAGLLLALGAAETPAAAQLQVAAVHRVAEGPGVRDRPAVSVGPTAYAVFWEEAPAITASTAPNRNFRLFQQAVAFDGTLLGTAAPVVDRWGHQWGAATAAEPGRSWLAYYFADRAARTGDRDLGLFRLDGFFDRPVADLRLTADPRVGPPVNQASPALLWDPDSQSLALASSTGVYHGEGRGTRGPYDSVNIEVRLLDAEGRVQREFLVKGPDETGESITPVLAILPAHWRERYILGYASNAGRRSMGSRGYSIFLELYNREWRVVGGRHLAKPAGGAARPALATVGDKLYAAWVDNDANDVIVSEMDQQLHPVWPMSLRAALGDAGFAARFGEGAPGLSAPVLYEDHGWLGIGFVATWEWQPATGHARQEVFVGRIRYR